MSAGAKIGPTAGTGQTATLPDVACGTVQPNPVVDRSGAPVALTGDGYDAATDSFPNTVAGTHQDTWDVQLSDVAIRFSGTLTQTVLSCVSAPVEPSEPEPVRRPWLLQPSLAGGALPR